MISAKPAVLRQGEIHDLNTVALAYHAVWANGLLSEVCGPAFLSHAFLAVHVAPQPRLGQLLPLVDTLAGSELTSMHVGALAPGSSVEVHEFVDLPDGTQRARIDMGWLTAKTANGKLLISQDQTQVHAATLSMEHAATPSRHEPFEWNVRMGSEWLVASKGSLIVRAGFEVSSEYKGELVQGTLVQMLGAVELLDGTRRARVTEGWLTWVTKEGKQNLRSVHALGPEFSAEFLGVRCVAIAHRMCIWQCS